MEDSGRNSKPYIQFWEKWICSDACFFNDSELKQIDDYLIQEIQLSDCLLNEFLSVNRISGNIDLDEKLKREYQRYKDWVVLNFLISIMNLYNEHGDSKFYLLSINELDIPEVLKENLRKIEIHSVSGFFDKYSVGLTEKEALLKGARKKN